MLGYKGATNGFEILTLFRTKIQPPFQDPVFRTSDKMHSHWFYSVAFLQ